MIIGVSGKARSGKNTFTEMLQKELDNLGHLFVDMAYADELKLRVMHDFNLSYEQVYGKLKEVPDHRYAKGNLSSNPYEAFWTPREILQYIGTEGFRKIDSKFWIRQLFNKINTGLIRDVIVTDCRFPDEVDAIIEAGGIHIRVERDNKDFVADTQHLSETALDNYNNTYCIINNNSTLEGLRKIAKDIAEEVIRLKTTKLEKEVGGL